MFIEKTLGQLCELGKGKIQTGPFGSQLHQADYSEEGTPVVMPADIIDGKISEAKIARVSEDHVMRLERHQLAIGDIVYGRRGDIGRQALITSKEEGWLCGTGCLRVTVGKKSPIDPEYLHLYLKMPDVISYIQNQAIGATMPNLNTEILKRIPIRYPEKIADQKKVIAVLKAYFDLIENNKKRIQILENMAEELYKEWFVRFRFPNWENTEFEKGLPVGWKNVRFDSFCKFKKGKNPEEILNSPDDAVMYINMESLTGEGTSYARKQKNSVECSIGDLLMLMDGSRSGLVFRANNMGIVGSTLSIIEVNNKFKNYVFEYLKAMKTSIVSNNTGSAIPHANKDYINRMLVCIPDNLIISKFNEIYDSQYLLIKNLQQQIKWLEQTKTALLPRLISGKLSVENLDIQFPPSMQEQ
ncbi:MULTISPECIES: restriction endonuclease subunit S [Acinetobacter]|uniref:restriction endonuclease subunit S n=1 Tax=Acinetobacter TaxID=469 RepID=UPI0015D270BD|nr:MULTISPECIES: restriction endonuclease subunit S [Acinetobacter]MCO8047064.1 restriction endonuclease subunit S [Acinetobacter towneri]